MKVFEKTVQGIFYNGTTLEVKNLVIRSSFSNTNFGTVSIADEKRNIMLQVSTNELFELIQKARDEV